MQWSNSTASSQKVTWVLSSTIFQSSLVEDLLTTIEEPFCALTKLDSKLLSRTSGTLSSSNRKHNTADSLWAVNGIKVRLRTDCVSVSKTKTVWTYIGASIRFRSVQTFLVKELFQLTFGAFVQKRPRAWRTPPEWILRTRSKSVSSRKTKQYFVESFAPFDCILLHSDSIILHRENLPTYIPVQWQFRWHVGHKQKTTSCLLIQPHFKLPHCAICSEWVTFRQESLQFTIQSQRWYYFVHWPKVTMNCFASGDQDTNTNLHCHYY